MELFTPANYRSYSWTFNVRKDGGCCWQVRYQWSLSFFFRNLWQLTSSKRERLFLPPSFFFKTYFEPMVYDKWAPIEDLCKICFVELCCLFDKRWTPRWISRLGGNPTRSFIMTSLGEDELELVAWGPISMMCVFFYHKKWRWGRWIFFPKNGDMFLVENISCETVGLWRVSISRSHESVCPIRMILDSRTKHPERAL